MEAVDRNLRHSLLAKHSELMAWLLGQAYPLWSTRGIDSVRGGFQERLTLAGEGTDDPRRARVQPRQIYAFSRAAGLGWNGDATGAMSQGLEYFLTRYRRADGLFRTLVTPDGMPLDDRALLYDQAFALLAFATAAPLLGDSFNLAGEGEQLRLALSRHLKRSGLGFESGDPPSPPLLSNPHMHLLEAALAWLECGEVAQWRGLADELGGLALTHLIDPATGLLHETFDASWQPTRDVAGQLVEPGHQFEWAWLLMRWGAGRAEVQNAASKLIDLAEQHGVRNGLAINVLSKDPSVHDASARLWPQTERLRASASAARLWGGSRYWEMATSAATAVLRYLQTPVSGLWYDRISPAGDLVPETVTAGNFYHLVGAIYEMDALVRSGGINTRIGIC